jgi:hypothetical protein
MPISFKLAAKDSPSAQRGQPRHGIGRRSASGFASFGKGMVKLIGTILVDQGHHALGDFVGQEELVIDRSDDVDDGIAHRDDIEAACHILPNPLKLRL